MPATHGMLVTNAETTSSAFLDALSRISFAGGRSWAEGAVGAGATFYFSIPKRNGTSVNDKIIGVKTILLAEDDPGDAELTLAALEEIQLADNVVVVNVNEPPPCQGEEEELLQKRAVIPE